MSKKQKISLNELNSLVNSFIKPKKINFFDLNLRLNEEESVLDQLTTNIADKAIKTFGPSPVTSMDDAGRALKTAQNAASDVVSKQMYKLFGPADADTIEIVEKFEQQVNKVAENTSLIFNSYTRKLNRKLQFKGEKHRQAIFSIGSKDKNQIYPGLDDVKKYFLLFSNFCSSNTDFSVNEFNGTCPVYSDPGGWCLNDSFKIGFNKWDKKRRAILVKLRDCQNDEETKAVLDKAVDLFMKDFSNLSIKLPTGKLGATIQNFTSDSYSAFLSENLAKTEIFKIYKNNKTIFNIKNNTVKAERQFRRAAPSIIDCFCLLFKPIHTIFYSVKGDKRSEEKKLATSCSTKGMFNYLDNDFRLKTVTNLLKTDEQFKKNWFSFTANMFYDPANERGHEFWRRDSDIYTDGTIKGKDGFTLLATIGVTTIETAFVAGAVKKTAEGLKVLKSPNTKALTRSPQAFVFIMLAIGIGSAIIYAFDPFGWYNRSKKIEQSLEKIKLEFVKLKEIYSKQANKDQMVEINEQSVKNSLKVIEAEGKVINSHFSQIANKFAEYGIENKNVHLKYKKSVVAQVLAVAQWIQQNTNSKNFNFMPTGEIPKVTATNYADNLQKSSENFQGLIDELSSNKDSVKKKVKLVLPHFNLDQNRIDLPSAINLGRPDGTLLDMIPEEREGTMMNILGLGSSGEIHPIKDLLSDGQNPNADIINLHKRLHKYFHNTFYNLNKQGMTATGDLDDSTIQMIRRKIVFAFQEMKKNANEYGSQNIEDQCKREWTKWLKSGVFFGKWPSREKMKNFSTNKNDGIITSTLYDGQFRDSKNNMGMISSVQFGNKKLYAVFGPSLGLRNTALFEAKPSAARKEILDRSKFFIYPDYAKEVIEKNVLVAAPKLKLLGKDKKSLADIFLREQNLISEYSKLLEISLRSSQSSAGTDRPVRGNSQTSLDPKKRMKIRAFKHILNIYEEVIKLTFDAIRTSAGGDAEQYYTSVQQFESAAKQLQKLDESQYNNGTGSGYRNIINSLEDSAAMIFRIYVSYTRILKILKQNDTNIDFMLILNDLDP